MKVTATLQRDLVTQLSESNEIMKQFMAAMVRPTTPALAHPYHYQPAPYYPPYSLSTLSTRMPSQSQPHDHPGPSNTAHHDMTQVPTPNWDAYTDQSRSYS